MRCKLCRRNFYESCGEGPGGRSAVGARRAARRRGAHEALSDARPGGPEAHEAKPGHTTRDILDDIEPDAQHDAQHANTPHVHLAMYTWPCRLLALCATPYGRRSTITACACMQAKFSAHPSISCHAQTPHASPHSSPHSSLLTPLLTPLSSLLSSLLSSRLASPSLRSPLMIRLHAALHREGFRGRPAAQRRRRRWCHNSRRRRSRRRRRHGHRPWEVRSRCYCRPAQLGLWDADSRQHVA